MIPAVGFAREIINVGSVDQRGRIDEGTRNGLIPAFVSFLSRFDRLLF